MVEPPTREHLAGPEPLSLDGREVVKNFLGKTHADALRMFASRSGFSTEDFMWMAVAGLRYYLGPAQDYLLGDASKGDWQFARGLLCSLAFRAEEKRLPRDLLRQIRLIADDADVRRAKYGINARDDGFSAYLQRIRKAFG